MIAAYGESELHANVSPITIHFRNVDRLGLSKRLSEIWVRIFFNECAKFGGSHSGHRVEAKDCADVRRDRRARDSSEYCRCEVRIGRCTGDMWHNFCNRGLGYKGRQACLSPHECIADAPVMHCAGNPFHEFFHQHSG